MTARQTAFADTLDALINDVQFDTFNDLGQQRIREDLALLSERILPPDRPTATVSRT